MPHLVLAAENASVVRRHVQSSNPHAGARDAMKAVPFESFDWPARPSDLSLSDPRLVWYSEDTPWGLYAHSKRDVRSYAKRINKGEQPPAIVAGIRDGRIVIFDGAHRAEAAKLAGLRSIKAYLGTPVAKVSAMVDTDDVQLPEQRDSGRLGKVFETAFLRACDLLGLQYDSVPGANALYDLRTKGKGWTRIAKGKRTNLKVARTKWMFASAELAAKLPWDEAAWLRWEKQHGPFDPGAAAKMVKDFLVRKGLRQVNWLRPRTDAIVNQIIEAAFNDDVETLERVFVRKNFESFMFKEFRVQVSIHSDRNRVGSISLRMNGRTVARSERPRIMGGSLMVGFRREAKAPEKQHAAKSRA